MDESERRAALARFRELLTYRWECDTADCDGLPHRGMPHKHARGNQRVVGDAMVNMFSAGRGFGKTRTAAEYVKKRMLAQAGHRAIIVAPSFGIGRDVCIEGESGLVGAGGTPGVLPPDRIKTWNRSNGELILANGSMAKIYGANTRLDADRIRGAQAHTVWFEELAAAPQQKYAYDMALMALRLGSDPRAIISTTPRPTALIRALTKDPSVRIVHGSTWDNVSNLAAPFIAKLSRDYAGTRMGEQELEGKLLEDVAGALLTREKFRHVAITNVDEFVSSLSRVVVAIDPPGSHRGGAECGIAVVGLNVDGTVWVIEDASFHATPEQWSSKAVELFHRYGADRVVAEGNFGGDMVAATMRAAGYPVPEIVTASRGKAIRAEPVVSLYEQGRIFHVGPEGALADLETQWATWVPPGQEEVDEHGVPTPIPASDWSPDRIDACVWAISSLVLQPKKARTTMRYTP